MEFGLFRKWLEDYKGLKQKSAGDVISRLKRVNKLIEVDSAAPYEKILLSLENNEEFKNLSLFVKPQLRQAIKLYKEFIQEIKE
jgi:hypothetical protein